MNNKTSWISDGVFLGLWVLVNTFGAILLVRLIQTFAFGDTMSEFEYYLPAVFIWVVFGGIIGLFLGIVLRQLIPQINFISWCLATSVGWIAGSVLGWILGGFLFKFYLLPTVGLSWILYKKPIGLLLFLANDGVLWIVFGATIGFCQWFVLKRQVTKAGWWIVGSAVGWGIGMTVGLGEFNESMGSSGNVTLGGFLIGLITGLMLLLLLFIDQKNLKKRL